MACALLAGAIVMPSTLAAAQNPGEKGFDKMKANQDHFIAYGCTFNRPPNEKGNGAMWDQEFLILLENDAPADEPQSPADWKIALLTLPLNTNSALCVETKNGPDDVCGSGFWTDTWGKCAMREMRRQTRAVPLSTLDRDDLLSFAKSHYCGAIEIKFDIESGYRCHVTTADGQRR